MRTGVIGSGQMGSGIAQVCATQGLEVYLCDRDTGQLDKAKTSIARSLQKLRSKEVITAAAEQAALHNITYTTSDEGLAQCELIIEAVSEDETLKKNIFTRLDQLTPAATILASNTSSIPITRLAACTQRPDQIIGLHFMNPVPLMRLVEIIPTAATSSSDTHQNAGTGQQTRQGKRYQSRLRRLYRQPRAHANDQRSLPRFTQRHRQCRRHRQRHAARHKPTPRPPRPRRPDRSRHLPSHLAHHAA